MGLSLIHISISKGPGAAVIAGTVASGGSLRVRVTAVGGQTALSGIMRLVAAAQASGSRTQALADRAAAILFYVAVGSGAITSVYWWFSGDKEHALIRTATVLIIACPHALGLAIPLVIAISTSLGAQNGLLVKDRLALERARNLDMVIFDKTGTLTRGSPALSGVAAAPGSNESDLLALAAAVEANSEHPLAKAVVAEEMCIRDSALVFELGAGAVAECLPPRLAGQYEYARTDLRSRRDERSLADARYCERLDDADQSPHRHADNRGSNPAGHQDPWLRPRQDPGDWGKH